MGVMENNEFCIFLWHPCDVRNAVDELHDVAHSELHQVETVAVVVHIRCQKVSGEHAAVGTRLQHRLHVLLQHAQQLRLR